MLKCSQIVYQQIALLCFGKTSNYKEAKTRIKIVTVATTSMRFIGLSFRLLSMHPTVQLPFSFLLTGSTVISALYVSHTLRISNHFPWGRGFYSVATDLIMTMMI